MSRSGKRTGYAGSVAIVGVTTLAAAVLHTHVEPSDLTMLYLLSVVICAIAFGRGPAVAAALLSVALFDFLYVPPRFTFRVSESHYLVTFAVMLVVAVVTGTLTAHVRDQREKVLLRETRLASLHRLSHDLAVRGSASEVLAAAVGRIGDVLGVSAAASLPDGRGGVTLAAGDASVVGPEPERAAVVSAMLHARALGAPYGVPAGVRGVHLPLATGARVNAVLSLRAPEGAPPFDSERLEMLRAFTNLTALALERCRLTDEARAVQTRVEAEQARSALLSSVSHDLRTPLAAIAGAASALRDAGGGLEPDARRELVETIAQEAHRLNRLIGNLLEMTRLESGAPRVRKEWHSLEEVIGSSLTLLEPELGDRRVRVALAPALPLIPLDDVLFEQVVRNLVENANKYSPPGKPIEIRASIEDGNLRLEILDEGAGFAAGEEARLFEKFYRGSRAAAAPGVGLGLAICRGIVEAHGGTIEAANRPEGGARFTVRVPIEGAPPAVEDEPPVEPIAGDSV
ncbi:MAG TPA: DUF4118 domain-containing protein [Candidatus Eisenbacteria bacterium]|nr:DUF4118 domain-containing protein [Candidatus Eisenbacteria bacterium]